MSSKCLRDRQSVSLGYDLLDRGIGRLHTNIQISATLSKKVMIFPKRSIFLQVQGVSSTDVFFELARTDRNNGF